MNKIIIGIGITVVLILGLVWIARPANQSTGNATHMMKASLLGVQETNFDFGTISMANGKVRHQFKVINSSSQPLNLKKIYSSCMCTAANFVFGDKTYGPFGMQGMGGLTSINVTLNPNDSATVEAVYDPAAHGPAGVGAVDRFIYLEDADGGQLKLEIKAIVTP